VTASLGASFCLSGGFKAFEVFTDLVGFFLEVDFRFKLFWFEPLVGFLVCRVNLDALVALAICIILTALRALVASRLG